MKEKVFVVNKTILDMLSNFIQYETLTVDDKDFHWFSKNIKNINQEKSNMYKSCKNISNIQFLKMIQFLQQQIHNKIVVSKLN